ncbi:MAG: VOC family protein [Thermomicrobiales bacterium]
MARMIFPNLPVKDVAASTAFYEALGFTKNAQFSDDRTASMVVDEHIVIMLLEESRWKEFTTKAIPDGKTSSEVMIALSAESKDEVDGFYTKGLAAGGSEGNPLQDLGFMYGKSVQDPDGHILEFVWMDPAVVQG